MASWTPKISSWLSGRRWTYSMTRCVPSDDHPQQHVEARVGVTEDSPGAHVSGMSATLATVVEPASTGLHVVDEVGCSVKYDRCPDQCDQQVSTVTALQALRAGRRCSRGSTPSASVSPRGSRIRIAHRGELLGDRADAEAGRPGCSSFVAVVGHAETLRDRGSRSVLRDQRAVGPSKSLWNSRSSSAIEVRVGALASVRRRSGRGEGGAAGAADETTGLAGAAVGAAGDALLAQPAKTRAATMPRMGRFTAVPPVATGCSGHSRSRCRAGSRRAARRSAAIRRSPTRR